MHKIRERGGKLICKKQLLPKLVRAEKTNPVQPVNETQLFKLSVKFPLNLSCLWHYVKKKSRGAQINQQLLCITIPKPIMSNNMVPVREKGKLQHAR